MLKWIYEAGIGEARAALIDDDRIIEAHIEPDDEWLRAGTVTLAQLTQIVIPVRRALVTCEVAGHTGEAMLEPVPKGVTQGAKLLVEITRTAIAEPGVIKRARARAVAPDVQPTIGAELRSRIDATGIPVVELLAHEADALEAAGWTECLEEADRGQITFDGGSLRVSLTPAMTLIDVDGYLAPASLALASARAAAAAIRRLGIAGSIGIDFPTLANKSERLATADAFDDLLPLPFERTAINGFGFLQIIRPRQRASLCERLIHDRVPSAARALLRRVTRSGIIGATQIMAHPGIVDCLAARPDWLAALTTQLGGRIDLRADTSLAIGGGYANKA